MGEKKSNKYIFCFFLLSCLIFVVILCFVVMACTSGPGPKCDKNSGWSSTMAGLRIIKVQMGNDEKDGVDGGFWGNKNLGGGRFNFKFCFGKRCCDTCCLKTDDDNWEKGEINYFVGYQIGACENFPLDSEGTFFIIHFEL